MIGEDRIRDMFDIHVEILPSGQTEYRIRTPDGYVGVFYDLITQLKETAIREAREEWKTLMELKEEFGMDDDEFDDWIYEMQNDLDWC